MESPTSPSATDPGFAEHGSHNPSKRNSNLRLRRPTNYSPKTAVRPPQNRLPNLRHRRPIHRAPKTEVTDPENRSQTSTIGDPPTRSPKTEVTNSKRIQRQKQNRRRRRHRPPGRDPAPPTRGPRTKRCPHASSRSQQDGSSPQRSPYRNAHPNSDCTSGTSPPSTQA